MEVGLRHSRRQEREQPCRSHGACACGDDQSDGSSRKDFGVKVMGDNFAAEDRVAAAKRLEDLGCDFVIHHIGYDERRGLGRWETISQSTRSIARGGCGGARAGSGKIQSARIKQKGV
jgi:3-keto-L-gulonate-6-phosphate decarboxylase